ncbi:MAG: VCBS repeat-containing protein [Tunicatimonas sp.]
MIILLSLSACQLADQTADSPVLFRAVFTLEAGDTLPAIDFINSIQETERQNFLSYPYLYNGGGVAIGDLDNDGLPDVYFTGNMAGDRLYHNQGSLKFTDVTLPAGIVKQYLWTTGVTMADINNDGYLDIYVCRSGDRGFRHNLLYINQGNFTFVEQARSWGINDNGYSTQATFFDYDLDGDLDLYLVNHSIKFNFNQEAIFKRKFTPERDEADQLYQNEGDHFTNVSQASGIRRFAFGLSATISDLNNDGYPDIYAASDFFEPDFLYINQQDGTFKEGLSESIGHTSFSSMGSDIADYNNDGLPDIVVADMKASDHYRHQANMVGMNRHKFTRMLKEGYHYQYMQNTLQLHRGMSDEGVPIFSEVGQLAGISDTDWSWSTLLFDMDNDGWKDLFISNGIRRDIQNKDAWTQIKDQREKKLSYSQIQAHFPVARLPNYTFRNNHRLGFTNVSSQWGMDFSGFTNGASYADLDRDGDLDLVLNNLDDAAVVYENLSQDQSYLQVELRGREDNRFGLGAKVFIHYGDSMQFQELTTTRGFQSSVPPTLHFGLGKRESIDQLEVHWPNGSHQVVTDLAVNRKITLDQQGATVNAKPPGTKFSAALLHPTSLVSFVHEESPSDDFDREPLLPFTLSNQGPCLAVGDINGDQREDVFLGNGAGYAGTLLIQQENGSFTPLITPVLEQDKAQEDVDAALVDIDQDQDLDLYVVSGSHAFEADATALADRLYINDGQGNFTRGVLPDIRANSSCVAATDVDQDGDIDLFVGGSTRPGQYPWSSPSYLLLNENGTFVPQVITTSGVVTDAVWTDIDQDLDDDLVVVGHWMPVTVWKNQQGQLKPGNPLTIQDTLGQVLPLRGWWNSITKADLDQDGDDDFVLGNEGLNTRFNASPTEPLEIFAKDFDQNGSPETILAHYQDGQSYPVVGRDKLIKQLPSWQRRFPDYDTYAQATIEKLLAETDDHLLHYQATQLASGILYSEGDASFTFVPLPEEAQISATNDAIAEDINRDGKTDLVIAGNHYGWEVETSRNDASIGLCLLGDGQRRFRPLTLQESGFLASGDVRTLQKLRSVTGNTMILVGRNQQALIGFSLSDTSDLITLSNAHF